MSGVRLPEAFLIPDRLGHRGGVELGFMAASASKEQAMAYIEMSKCMCDLEPHPSPGLNS